MVDMKKNTLHGSLMLREYRKKHRIKQKDFASLLGVTSTRIHEIEAGKGLPSLDLAARIERATKGAVPAISWVPERPNGEAA